MSAPRSEEGADSHSSILMHAEHDNADAAGAHRRRHIDVLVALLDYLNPNSEPVADPEVERGADDENLDIEEWDDLFDSLSSLVHRLDTVARIYPVTVCAIQTFEASITLLKRRRAESLTNLVILEMRDMMQSLVQLQAIPDNVGPDGIGLHTRLHALMSATTRDIMEGANACDAYLCSRPVVQVVNAVYWQAIFSSCITRFRNRRAEFSFAFAIHAPSASNVTLEMPKCDLPRLPTKRVPPKERTLTITLQRGGTEVVYDSEDTLRDEIFSVALLMQHSKISPSHARSSRLVAGRSDGLERSGFPLPRNLDCEDVLGQIPRPSTLLQIKTLPPQLALQSSQLRSTRDDGVTSIRSRQLVELMEDVAEEPTTTCQMNFARFERRLEVQMRVLSKNLLDDIAFQSDVVISHVTGGVDPQAHIRDVWETMGWRDSVDSLTFVSALCLYYLRSYADQQYHTIGDLSVRQSVHVNDVWTLPLLDDMQSRRRIAEALDREVSGVVDMAGINRFFAARPRHWSLLHWLAFWSVGWPNAMATYKRKIYAYLSSMYRLCASTYLPNNIKNVFWQCLVKIEPLVARVTSTFYCDFEDHEISYRFQDYVEDVEENIQANLKILRYDLDGISHLDLIDGSAKVETNAFIMIYLLLRRQDDIMALAQTIAISKEELMTVPRALALVSATIQDRAREVAAQNF
ncbi:hypothetical protein ONZ51_g5846 [Trametes cubensis]|uniref:Uncharacterized protein n=1 Tax=Trametes cubensis TaxID=1111947 RepID=A0AAD7TUD3_9APHY|nr:hypothetical protein ONZ51_g5846 [Trametes cubensis]